VVTVAGEGPRLDNAGLSDPFGVAVAPAGDVFITDGAGGRVFRIGRDGSVTQAAAGLDMPSAVAVGPDGALLVANTGAHTIVRIDPASGAVEVLAGSPGQSGFADGAAAAALFNGPIGVAAGPDGTVYVADTYNDRIRAVDPGGQVRTLAGGEPGFADGDGPVARFHTPCGLAVAHDGSLLVADSGNHRVRRVDPAGAVTTLAGTGEADERDGPPLEASFGEPIAVALRDERSVYVADAAGATVRVCRFGAAPGRAENGAEASGVGTSGVGTPAVEAPGVGTPGVDTLAGAWPPGLVDGELGRARFNRPSGIALAPTGELYVADAGNGLVRALVPADAAPGFESASSGVPVPPPAIRSAVPPRWPFDPPEARREIAATFGEIRGERRGDKPVWWHNGLDVPGAYGETVRAIYGERVSLPLAVDGAGGPRERIRFPLFGYIHIRVGRDRNDEPLEADRVTILRDDEGKVADVRVRRGTLFRAGDPLGTLNNQNHVHMIAGPARGEVNALAALELPGLSDRIAPVIEGVAVVSPTYEPYVDEMPKERAGPRQAGPRQAGPRQAGPRQAGPVTGAARILVRAYDQMDGNASRRRLGLYRVGYQVLGRGGTPAPGFEQPRFDLVFERLPADPTSAWVAYAEGSQSGYTGSTVFTYIATNVVRDGEAREGFWDAGALPPGRYTVRVFAGDFFGNQSTRDVEVEVAGV
jgi:sugar lactone lactonase YvrE